MYRGKSVIDYSKEKMSSESGYLVKLCQDIKRIGMIMEKELGPQDIEGAIVDDKIYIV